MRILSIDEQEDFCACNIEFTTEETQLLMEYALIDLLRKHIESGAHLKTPLKVDEES